jgi:cell division protein FtsQ
MFKKALILISWIMLLSGVFFLLGFSALSQDKMPCTGFDISIDYQGGDHLITTKMIRSRVNESSGNPLKQSLSQINTEKISKLLSDIPYIAKADVFLTIEGRLVARLVQRKPMMRIINRFGQQYYADADGALMPANFAYPARVIIVNGNITFPYSSKIRLTDTRAEKSDTLQSRLNLYKAFRVVKKAVADSFLTAQVSQLYLNSENEIEITPAFGDHLIMFGDTTNTIAKFEKLKAFYIQGISRTGWETYRVINLKYENQIICTK